MRQRTVVIVTVSVILAVLSIMFGRSSRVFRGASSIGYVSMQRILAESPEAKATAARLQELQQQKTRELTGLQQAFEVTRTQLLGGGLAPAARTRLEQQAQQQQGEFERASAQAQADLQAGQRQFQNDLRQQLTPVLEAVSRTRNVQVVLNEDSAVVWAAQGFDLTADVIEKLKTAPKPSAAPTPNSAPAPSPTKP